MNVVNLKQFIQSPRFFQSCLALGALVPNLFFLSRTVATPIVSSLPENSLDMTFSDINEQKRSTLFSKQEIESLIVSQPQPIIAQIPKVSQLRDVSPDDWSYEALQGLVERYGCIVGYPNSTYRGTQALSRYEFTAGLNACLNQIERLLQENVSVAQQDIEILQRLVTEFQEELDNLSIRVDNLESRTAFLEDHQFSTTTKLYGEAVFNLGQSFGQNRADGNGELDNITTLGNRSRVILSTSFTGKDILFTRLQGVNIGQPDTGTGMTALHFGGNTENSLRIHDFRYITPIGDDFRLFVGLNHSSFDDFADALNPLFVHTSLGSLSFFGAYNVLLYPFLTSNQALAGNVKFSDNVSLDVGYTTNTANSPELGNGLFNGTFSTSSQLNWTVNPSFKVALTYTYSFQTEEDVTLTDTLGSPLGDNPFGDDTSAHRAGFTFNWEPTSRINIGSWFGYANAQAQAGKRKGDNAEIFTWATTFALLDVGKEGSVIGLIVGMPPKATYIEGGLADPDTSLLVEAQYRFPINDNLLITPGTYVVFNPNHDNRNSSIWIGTIRATFSF
ncbi:MAG: iron uptake porin [Microcystaceae cyanobacterium]